MINYIGFNDIYAGSELEGMISRFKQMISTNNIQWDETGSPKLYLNKEFKLKLQLQDVLLKHDLIEHEISVPPNLLRYKQYDDAVPPSSHEELAVLLSRDLQRYLLVELQRKGLLSLDTMDSFIRISIAILKQTCELIITSLQSPKYANLNPEQKELILTQLRYMISILYNMQDSVNAYIRSMIENDMIALGAKIKIANIYALEFFRKLIKRLNIADVFMDQLDIGDIIHILENIAEVEEQDFIKIDPDWWGMSTLSWFGATAVSRRLAAHAINQMSFISDRLTFGPSSIELVNSFFKNLDFQTIFIIAMQILLAKPIYELIIEYGPKMMGPRNDDDEKKNIVQKCILDLVCSIYDTNKDKILEMLCVVDPDNKNTDKLIANIGLLLFGFILRNIKEGELSAEDKEGLKIKIDYISKQIPYIKQKLNERLAAYINPSSENPVLDPQPSDTTQTSNKYVPFRRPKIETSRSILKTIYENKILAIITVICILLIILTSIIIIIYCLFKISIFCFIYGYQLCELLILCVCC